MIKITLENGNTIICGNGTTYKNGGYLQLLNKKGQEIIYYDVKEWAEEPELVIGAFMQACKRKRPITGKITGKKSWG